MRSLVGMFLLLFCVVDLEKSNAWCDVSCRRAYDAKQTTYHVWFRAPNATHMGQFVLARAEAQRVYGAARESHNEPHRNTLKHSICSDKLWESLTGPIFGMEPSIPSTTGPGCDLVVAPAEKSSLLVSQFDTKCCRQFVLFPKDAHKHRDSTVLFASV